MFDSSWPHGLQHTRPPCPSPSPRVCSSSCSLHEWCCPPLLSSDTFFSFCPQSFPAFLIPDCASSSPVFPMMYFAYKLKEQGKNLQPLCTLFPILNQSLVPCPVLAIASWPKYRFLRRQIRWSDISISLRIFHSLLWSTQSKALALSMKQMFFWNSLAFSVIHFLKNKFELIHGFSVMWLWASSSVYLRVLPYQTKLIIDLLWNEIVLWRT